MIISLSSTKLLTSCLIMEQVIGIIFLVNIAYYYYYILLPFASHRISLLTISVPDLGLVVRLHVFCSVGARHFGQGLVGRIGSLDYYDPTAPAGFCQNDILLVRFNMFISNMFMQL